MAKKNIAKKEIIIAGFGGQGIVLAGRILGEAAALGDHKESTLTQSYGPESRGGACNTQVIISDKVIAYPYVNLADILVCMSQGGFDKFIGQIADNGILLTDKDLVNVPAGTADGFYTIPATRMAEELGRKMMANIIMIGFLTAVTGVISKTAAQNAVTGSVPKGTEEMNMKAFNKGCDYGLAVLKSRKKKASGRAGAV